MTFKIFRKRIRDFWCERRRKRSEGQDWKYNATVTAKNSKYNSPSNDLRHNTVTRSLNWWYYFFMTLVVFMIRGFGISWYCPVESIWCCYVSLNCFLHTFYPSTVAIIAYPIRQIYNTSCTIIIPLASVEHKFLQQHRGKYCVMLNILLHHHHVHPPSQHKQNN